MAYQRFGKIEAADFNALVGPSTGASAGQLNQIWGIGVGNRGYGQTAISQVEQHNVVQNTNWASAINTSKSIANHQNTTITSLAAPSDGDPIVYLSAISTNTTTLTNARLNAVAVGTTAQTSASQAGTWTDSCTFVATVTFASGDAARYYFNAGGQIGLNFYSPSGSGIDALMNTLGGSCGTVWLSSPSSGTATIAGTNFSGITQTGIALGTPSVISTNSGYYALGTTDTQVFKMLASGTPAGYVNSSIAVSMKTNGTQGANGDNGSIITITVVWDEIPNGLAVSTGTSLTVTLRPPSTSYLTNTWGSPTVGITTSRI